MQAKKYFIIFSYCKRTLSILKTVSVKLIAYVLQQHLCLASFCYLFQQIFIARCKYIIPRCRSDIIVQEWWNALEMRRISSLSHIIWASGDLRNIQSLDYTNSRDALRASGKKVARQTILFILI